MLIFLTHEYGCQRYQWQGSMGPPWSEENTAKLSDFGFTSATGRKVYAACSSTLGLHGEVIAFS